MEGGILNKNREILEIRLSILWKNLWPSVSDTTFFNRREKARMLREFNELANTYVATFNEIPLDPISQRPLVRSNAKTGRYEWPFYQMGDWKREKRIKKSHPT
ncbi:MAG: hypothetical protein Q8P05_00755 [Candidatus Diapherotrites archaeon]|nr:hypothetical protein [Candidatus Diapherotrites archaeon]MDZ4256499.1 hypothetical protein [archaeon]